MYITISNNSSVSQFIGRYFVHSSSADFSLLMCTSLFYFAFFFHVTENCMTLCRNISLKIDTAMVLIIDGVAADVTQPNVRWSWWRRLWVSMRARRFACAAIANHSLAACTAPFAPRSQAGSDESDPEMYTQSQNILYVQFSGFKGAAEYEYITCSGRLYNIVF